MYRVLAADGRMARRRRHVRSRRHIRRRGRRAGRRRRAGLRPRHRRPSAGHGAEQLQRVGSPAILARVAAAHHVAVRHGRRRRWRQRRSAEALALVLQPRERQVQVEAQLPAVADGHRGGGAGVGRCDVEHPRLRGIPEAAESLGGAAAGSGRVMGAGRRGDEQEHHSRIRDSAFSRNS